MAAPDTFFGASLSLANTTVKSLDILSGSRSGVSADDIETTHAGTTSNTGDAIIKTYIPGDAIEGGNYSFTVAFDNDESIDTIVGVEDTFTLQYAAQSGQSTGAKHDWDGYINGYDADMPIDDRMTADISVKVAKNSTYTAGS